MKICNIEITLGIIEITLDIIEITLKFSNLLYKFRKMLTFSWLFRKCFPVSQEVVGIKNRPDIEFSTSFIDVFVTHCLNFL